MVAVGRYVSCRQMRPVSPALNKIDLVNARRRLHSNTVHPPLPLTHSDNRVQAN